MSSTQTGPLGGAILVVCTANICRSPMSAGLLARQLGRSTVTIQVTSGGFLESGRPVDPFAVSAMAARGVDISTHTSTQVTPTLLRQADLVITMTADHVQLAVDMDPKVWPRVFTLTDLTARMAAIGPRRSTESLAGYVARLHVGRTAAALMAAGSNGDIADPYGGPLSAFERTADQLDKYATQVVSSILGLASVPRTDETAAPGAKKPRRALPGLFRR